MTATVQSPRPATPAFTLPATVANALNSLRKSGDFYVRLAYDQPWLRDAEADAERR